MTCFKEHWDINAVNFSEMYLAATAKTDNLLVSQNNFLRKQMNSYAQKDPNAVRSMFIDLYDESKPVTERITTFQNKAQELCDKYSPGYQHYQRPMAISEFMAEKYRAEVVFGEEV